MQDLIDALAEFAPPPQPVEASTRTVDPREAKMTGFVFKIQANMDPNHRDRIAFLRVTSGRLVRGMKARLSRTGKNMAINAPQFFFAQDRQLAEEAFAGDVVGIPNHGALRIGDTLTDGENLVFRGVPSFAPEILRRVKLGDAMKAKKLREALQQMAEEGVVQLFLPHDGAPAMVGVVGALQLDVLIERLQAEYGLPVSFESSRFEVCRWVSADDANELEKFVRAYPSSMANDLDGARCFWPNRLFRCVTIRSAGRRSVSMTSRIIRSAETDVLCQQGLTDGANLCASSQLLPFGGVHAGFALRRFCGDTSHAWRRRSFRPPSRTR